MVPDHHCFPEILLDPPLWEPEVAAAAEVLPQRFKREGYAVAGAGKLFHNRGNARYFTNYAGNFGGFGPFPDEKISPCCTAFTDEQELVPEDRRPNRKRFRTVSGHFHAFRDTRRRFLRKSVSQQIQENSPAGVLMINNPSFVSGMLGMVVGKRIRERLGIGEHIRVGSDENFPRSRILHEEKRNRSRQRLGVQFERGLSLPRGRGTSV